MWLDERPVGEIGLVHATAAAHLRGIPGVTCRDSRTNQVDGPLPELFRLFGVFTTIAAALTTQAPYC